jgi:hypothetical protein
MVKLLRLCSQNPQVVEAVSNPTECSETSDVFSRDNLGYKLNHIAG